MSSDKMETEPSEEKTQDAEAAVVEEGKADAETSNATTTTATAAPANTAAAAAPDDESTNATRSKKRPRSPSEPGDAAVMTAVSAASAAAAAQLSATMGWSGLYSLLSASALSTSTNLPTLEQVRQTAQKYVSDSPPHVHLSKTDSAPQLKIIDDHRLQLKGGLRGYRMSRASHGMSQGHYYFEVWVLDPPKVSEIVQALPSNVRMGTKLQQQVQQALDAEKEGKDPDPAGFGAHVRLGISNRTGDLQAPVGYDKWSYAIRDIGGARIHASQREDHWGGQSFGPGDVIGVDVCLFPPIESHNGTTHPTNGTGAADVTMEDAATASDHPETPRNVIRFFKNGQPMGEVLVSKHKKEASPAFFIPDGVYYPAVSLYMGASVELNPGPHFVYPPKKTSTPGMKLKPVSDLCPQPMSVEDAVAKVQKEKAFRKPEMLQKFQELVQTEVQVQLGAYASYRQRHVQQVMEQRKKRGVKADDLEQDAFYKEG
eukprot:Nitzschia sp. Nitz4//scaffold117_size69655//19764//21218//NITZ4_006019-RA/size69655-processed-gene-0.24-mRNA-1//1//CDS//3329533636//5351//frame0